MKNSILNLRINPLSLASSVFLLLSPFLTWITIVSVVIYQNLAIFGTAAQSNLFMFSSQEVGTTVSPETSAGALISVVSLIIAGLVGLRSSKVSVIIASLGLVAFIIPSYGMFGNTVSGFQYTFVSPGVGLFTALAGVLFGVLSRKTEFIPLNSVTRTIPTRAALTGIGVFVGSVALSLDILNHFALGQLPDFIGSNLAEQTLHLGLVAGLFSLVLIVVEGGRGRSSSLVLVAGSATLALLGADALYNIYYGTLPEFLGHNLTETVLHTAVYYGVAVTFIGALRGKANQPLPA